MTTETMPAVEQEPVTKAPAEVQSIEIERHTDKKSGALSIKADAIQAVPDAPRKEYWFGTTDDCPFQNVTCGGITFQRFTGTAVWDAQTHEPDRPEALRPGARAMLTEGQVNAAVRGVANRVFRPVGDADKGRALLLVKDGRGYVPKAGDMPAGRFLFMHDLSKTGGHPPAEPTPLVE